MNFYSRYYRSLWRGDIELPRGLTTRGDRNASITVPMGTTYRRKGDNPAIGFVEGLQFISGTFDPSKIAEFAPHAQLDLFTSQSAYGPRAVGQYASVIDMLLKDRYTRRAVIILGYPDEPLEDRPCTTSIQFHLIDRGGIGPYLDMTVTMRSSDAIWGLPYDLIQFSLLGFMIAKCVNAMPGHITVNIGNAHIYESTHKENSVWTTWQLDDEDIKLYTLDGWSNFATKLLTEATDKNQLYGKFAFREVGL